VLFQQFCKEKRGGASFNTSLSALLPRLRPALCGAVGLPAGTARAMSANAERSGRMSILVPMCVAQFTAADGAISKFKASSSYSRASVVSEFVKTVASTGMDYSLAEACAAGVEAEVATKS
jgi:hypothetical protein